MGFFALNEGYTNMIKGGIWKKRALKKGLKNIETILTDCKTKLEDMSIDIIICFDVLHDIEDKNCILKEFYRILKRESILSFDDHHMNEKVIIEQFTSGGFFKLVDKKENQYNFTKITWNYYYR